MSITREQALLEFAKISKDTPYALRTYLQTYDNTQSKYVPLNLFNDQVSLVNDYDNYEENIALKYRQAGVSTVTAAWASKKLITANKTKPEKILIIANKKDTAVEMAGKIRSFLDQWPAWLGVGFDPKKNANGHYKLTNECEVKAVATSKDALRGYTPTILIFDEAAYIEADDDFWAACMASLSTGGKVIVISTPNGFDTIYYPIYDQSLKGVNDFKITEMFWYRDPRYSRDLKLIKVDDIVHYMLNRQEYNDSEIIVDLTNVSPRDRDFALIHDYMSKGYRPYSSWFESMSKKLKFDRRKISQELECVDGETIVVVKHIENGDIINMKIKDLYSSPKSNQRYKILSPEGFVSFGGVQKLVKPTIELKFANGKILRCSHNHKIYYSSGKSVITKNVLVGDEIKYMGNYVVVESIVRFDEPSEVYDVINAGRQHLYYTNGIVSHNCNFLGSGDNVIPPDVVARIRENDITEPVNKFMGGAMWQWKEPEMNHKYIMGLDVSRGDSEDFTTFSIVDFDTREQVAEYIAKVPPDVAAEIAYKWGTMYSAFVVIDITGGMGVSTARKMQELGYKNLYIDGINIADKWKYNPKMVEKIPGINFNSKRVQIVAAFEEALRHDFKIRSQRLLNEIGTFVYINGRPDHVKGQHDDLIMAIAMAIYVGENSFSQLEKVTQQTKAMVDSWTVADSPMRNTARDFNPGVPTFTPGDYRRNPNSATREDYLKHSWLFGKI